MAIRKQMLFGTAIRHCRFQHFLVSWEIRMFKQGVFVFASACCHTLCVWQGWLACVVSERTTDKVGRSGILLPIEGDCWQVVMSARAGAP